jgi:transposase
VFCERVPGIARAHARQTERLADLVGAVGYVAGGLPAARLLERLAIRISDDSVRRRVVRNTAPEQKEPVRHLGVDDWAWRKYHTYGTILVDLDRHRVVDLLADRTAESLAFWLTQHSTVEVVARDRSGLYADGASEGAPQASQVADRFHLVLNLSTAIERVLEERSRELVLPAEVPAGTQPDPPPSPPVKPTAHQTRQQQRRQRRLARYQQVTELRQKGCSQLAISREVGISVKTVRRWLRADQFPERKPSVGRRKKVAQFAEYLAERWEAGCHNSTLLFQEIRARGYPGSRQMVSSFVSSWRHTGSRLSAKNAPQRIAPKHAAILAARTPEKLTTDQQALLDRLAVQCPDIVQLRSIALEFRDVLATHDGCALRRWIQETKRCRFGPVVRFAYGLQKDIAAVTAAVETTWSNGQVEGQINRLKAIKRQMFGRAGFAYLRARILPCPTLASPPAAANAP